MRSSRKKLKWSTNLSLIIFVVVCHVVLWVHRVVLFQYIHLQLSVCWGEKDVVMLVFLLMVACWKTVYRHPYLWFDRMGMNAVFWPTLSYRVLVKGCSPCSSWGTPDSPESKVLEILFDQTEARLNQLLIILLFSQYHSPYSCIFPPTKEKACVVILVKKLWSKPVISAFQKNRIQPSWLAYDVCQPLHNSKQVHYVNIKCTTIILLIYVWLCLHTHVVITHVEEVIKWSPFTNIPTKPTIQTWRTQ